MQDPDKNNLLAKWLDGSLSTEEAKGLGDAEKLAQLKAALDRVGDYDYPPMDEAALLVKTIEKRAAKSAKIRRLIPTWVKVAAAVVLLISMGWWYMDNQKTSVFAQNAEHLEVQLPAQSIVSLNAYTRLAYYEKNWSTERLLELDGEAFFNVTKGVAFKVESDHGFIRVLGTQFSIYDRDDLLEVICFEGKIKVTSSNQQEQILTKGQGVKFKDGVLFLFDNTAKSPDWLEGISTFKTASLERVFDELQRQYDLSINFSGVDLKRNFSGSFPHNDLNGALTRICGAMGLSYDIKGKQLSVY